MAIIMPSDNSYTVFCPDLPILKHSAGKDIYFGKYDCIVSFKNLAFYEKKTVMRKDKKTAVKTSGLGLSRNRGQIWTQHG